MVLAHVPLPASEYTDESRTCQCTDESPRANDLMPAQWYEALAAKTRRGCKFMELILTLGELSESALEKEVGAYIQFMRDASTADLEERPETRVPGLLVDLVSLDHCFAS